MFIDVHNHVLDYLEECYQKCEFTLSEVQTLYPSNMEVSFCASSNEKLRFIKQKELCSHLPKNIHPYYSFGIHPQAPNIETLLFLEKLLQKKEIIAIGECGFDLFTKEYATTLNEQKEAWNVQVELAIKYEVPLIIHCRRAMHLIFGDSKKLKKVKAVIFHGWGQGTGEATSLLKRGINAYFCIGKGILRLQKSQKEMARSFTITRLLTETDAPYMRLKNEMYTSPCNIEDVLRSIEIARTIPLKDIEMTLSNNFYKIFNL